MALTFKFWKKKKPEPLWIPTPMQSLIVEVTADLVNTQLMHWGRQSGKTTARKMIAERILADDNNSSWDLRFQRENPYLDD